MAYELTAEEQNIVDHLRSLPPGFTGAVTLHFDGKGATKWENKHVGHFSREPEKPPRRVIVRVSEERRGL